MMKGYKDSPIGKIPSDWEVNRFGEACINLDNLRKPIKSSDRQEVQGIYPYYGAQGIIDYIDDFIFEGIHLLIAEDGENVKSRKNEIALIADGKFWVNNHAHVVKNNSKSDIYFLKYYINFMDIKPYVTGLAQPKLNKSSLENLPIPLPPLPEQQKIAEILSTVDAKIEVIDQQITETQALKKGLMQRLLTKGIGHTEFKDSALGEIPRSWEVVRIGDLGNVVTGSTPKTSVDEFYAEEGVLWASPSDLTNIKYVNTTKKKLSPLGFEQTRKLPPKSILVTCIGSTIGKIGMTNSWMSTNQQINSIVCSDLNDSEFYYYVIEKNAEVIKSMAGNQAVPLLNKTDFSNILVIKPNLIEQQKISKILSSIDEKLEVLSEKKTYYNELKQGLMQQLLTGKIRVNNLIAQI